MTGEEGGRRGWEERERERKRDREGRGQIKATTFFDCHKLCPRAVDPTTVCHLAQASAGEPLPEINSFTPSRHAALLSPSLLFSLFVFNHQPPPVAFVINRGMSWLRAACGILLWLASCGFAGRLYPERSVRSQNEGRKKKKGLSQLNLLEAQICRQLTSTALPFQSGR